MLSQKTLSLLRPAIYSRIVLSTVLQSRYYSNENEPEDVEIKTESRLEGNVLIPNKHNLTQNPESFKELNLNVEENLAPKGGVHPKLSDLHHHHPIHYPKDPKQPGFDLNSTNKISLLRKSEKQILKEFDWEYTDLEYLEKEFKYGTL
ncbi:hypothetical protein AKO1_000449 [Acrasis kona]|uniref:Uncharacterized protein n=1 Tax=Acrasis kona TaxID=1008807 RepID=A0AAW2ZTX2_9EUKA